MVSKITSIIGDEGLNIVELLNKSKGDIAYNILDINGEVTDECLNKIKEIDGVVRGRLIPAAN